MLVVSILSALLQFWAALLALSLIKLTRDKTAWVLISIALSLMIIRRMAVLFFTANNLPIIDINYELVGLLISSFMLVGVYYIRPFIININKTAEDLKNSQQALLKAKEIAEKASIAKSIFLANLSHEIRTPLTSIIGFIELINKFEIDPQKTKDMINIISRNGEYLNQLIGNMLDLAKIEAGELSLKKTSFRLNDELQYIITTLTPQARRKSLKLIYSIGPNCPEFLNTDQIRLRQILINLVNNSLKYTEEGSIKILVSTERGQPNKLLFVIEDTGIGIPLEYQNAIFNGFFQVNKSNDISSGLGLGLALSKKLAMALGGDINLQYSKPNQGSRFIINLPVEKELSVVDSKLSQKALKVYNKNLIKNAKILLVEDGIDNQILIKSILEQIGISVVITSSGAAALEKLKQESFSLILSDIQMSPMDGYELLREIRKLGVFTPAIALTAYATNKDQEKCLAAGFYDYCSKPIEFTKFIELIYSSLETNVGQQAA